MATGDITALDTVQKIFPGEDSRWYSLAKLDTGEMLITFADDHNNGRAVRVNCLTPTYRMTEVGTGIEFDSGDGTHPRSIAVDSTNVMAVWGSRYSGNTPGSAGTLSIDSSDVVTANTQVNFDTDIETGNATLLGLAQMMTNYFIVGWYNDSDRAIRTRLIYRDPSTLATTNVGAIKAVSASTDGSSISITRINNTHFLACYERADGRGVARAFSVNLASGLITQLGSEVPFHDYTSVIYYIEANLIDTNRVLLTWYGNGSHAHARVLSVNTSTWAVTLEGSDYRMTTSAGYNMVSCVYDTNKFISFWRTVANDGKAQTYQIDPSTNEITTLSTLSPITVDSTYWNWGGVTSFESGYVACAWQGAADFSGDTDTRGHMQAFSIEMGSTPPSTSTKTQII